MRGMAEMTLIKLGEAVDKPQARRIKMVERALEEQKVTLTLTLTLTPTLTLTLTPTLTLTLP